MFALGRISYQTIFQTSFSILQCGRQFRGDPGDQGDPVVPRPRRVEAARHLQVVVRD